MRARSGLGRHRVDIGPVEYAPQVMNDSSTYVVVQTPRGRAAIATLLIEGPRALEFVSRTFQPRAKKSLETFSLGRVVLGTWAPGDVSTHTKAAHVSGEELIVCRLDEERIEVHCHASQAAVDVIVASLVRQGAVFRDWQEHAMATHDDPLIAEALVALASAPTDRTAGILLDQAGGALTEAVREIDRALAEQHPETAIDRLRLVLEFVDVGRHLTQPWSVVLAGPPNVGKSSLLNRLLGFERAIVFDQPGTTRDVVTSLASVDGWPIDLADTAGLRDSRDPLEHQGIEHARRQFSGADLVLVVDDVSERPSKGTEINVPDGTPTLRVLNKIDLLSEPRRELSHGIATSAVTGEGMDALRKAISTALAPRVPQVGQAVPFTAKQVQGLRQSLAFVEQGNLPFARDALKNLR